MQVDMDELVHVCFHGEMVEKLHKINEEVCSPFVIQERGER